MKDSQWKDGGKKEKGIETPTRVSARHHVGAESTSHKAQEGPRPGEERQGETIPASYHRAAQDRRAQIASKSARRYILAECAILGFRRDGDLESILPREDA